MGRTLDTQTTLSKLTALRGPGESYSDLIIRLAASGLRQQQIGTLKQDRRAVSPQMLRRNDAALESDHLTKRHLAAAGLYNGGKRPFGFDLVVDGNATRLVPNVAETAVIECMKAMRAAGSTYRDIGAATGHGPMSVKRILERMARA